VRQLIRLIATHLARWPRPAAAAIALALAVGGMAPAPSTSQAAPAVTGETLTMQSPKLSGFTHDGSRYELAAASATQPLHGAGGIALDQPRLELETAGGTTLTLSAASGVLDPAWNTLALRRDVVLAVGPGREIHLAEAHIDLRTNTLKSETPFEILANASIIMGQRLEVSEAGAITVIDGLLIHSGSIIYFDRYAVP
jgi:lipopolysaccharide export system protein LptC